MAEMAALQFADLEFGGRDDGVAGDKATALLDGVPLVQLTQVQAMFRGDINPVRVHATAVFRVWGTALDVGVVVDRYNALVDP